MWWWLWPYKKYCCLWFQNLLWVYVMAWMRVRFPGLKFCPSPPLHTSMSFCGLERLLLRSAPVRVQPVSETNTKHLCWRQTQSHAVDERSLNAFRLWCVWGRTLHQFHKRVRAITYVIWLWKGPSREEMEVCFLHCRPSLMTHWSDFPGAGQREWKMGGRVCFGFGGGGDEVKTIVLYFRFTRFLTHKRKAF